MVTPYTFTDTFIENPRSARIFLLSTNCGSMLRKNPRAVFDAGIRVLLAPFPLPTPALSDARFRGCAQPACVVTIKR